MSTINDLGSIAYKCEQALQGKLVDLYEEAHYLGGRLEQKIIEMYEDLHIFNETKRFVPLKDKLGSLIKLIDRNELDWIDMFSSNPIVLKTISIWPLVIFLFSAIICLGLSSCFHLFKDQSRRANKVLAKLDYAGISILVAGSFYPAIYYPFYCHQEYINLYLTAI